jgi:lysophospholipase L1-like esterase
LNVSKQWVFVLTARFRIYAEIMSKRFLALTYVVALHAALALVLWKSDFLQRVGLHLGITQTWPHYHSMVYYHVAQDPQVPAGAVIFIGDSLTQGLLVSEVTPLGVNYGIGGDNVGGAIQRVPHYKSLAKASAVVLAIGINDLSWRDDDRVLADYERLLATVPPGPRIIVSALLPVVSPTEAIRLENAPDRLAAFNARLRVLAEARGAFFLDAGPALADASGMLRAEYHVGDGLHLNAAGYAIWTSHLRQAVQASFQRQASST